MVLFGEAASWSRSSILLCPHSLKRPKAVSWMTDFLTAKKRSALMANVRSRGNTTTEERLRGLLQELKVVGWRWHIAGLPGRPDFIFPKERVAVFVNGCFWHGCPRCQRRSKSNVAFWEDKVSQNRKRDRRVARQLRSRNYRVVTIWECQLKGAQGEAAARRLLHVLLGRNERK